MSIFRLGEKVRYSGPLLDQIAPGQAEAIGTVVEDPQHPNARYFALFVPVRFDPPFGNVAYPESAGRWYIQTTHQDTALKLLSP